MAEELRYDDSIVLNSPVQAGIAGAAMDFAYTNSALEDEYLAFFTSLIDAEDNPEDFRPIHFTPDQSEALKMSLRYFITNEFDYMMFCLDTVREESAIEDPEDPENPDEHYEYDLTEYEKAWVLKDAHCDVLDAKALMRQLGEDESSLSIEHIATQ